MIAASVLEKLLVKAMTRHLPVAGRREDRIWNHGRQLSFFREYPGIEDMKCIPLMRLIASTIRSS